VTDTLAEAEPGTPAGGSGGSGESRESSEFRSGFVSLVGRPNVGKSTLVNCLVGQKVAIVSDRPQTTRSEIRGVRTTPTEQVVFLDTPGIHRHRNALGERTNQRAIATLASVDVVCLLVEAHATIGTGDRFIADLVHATSTPAICVINKIDRAARAQLVDALSRLGDGALGDFDAFVPLSAATGEGVDALVAEISARLEPGPHYYPEGTVTDQPESVFAAELLREQLIASARDELPHSIAVIVDDVEERVTKSGEALLALRAIVRVERESQKGIVIGRGGERLRAAGTATRRQLESLLGVRVHLDVMVRVDPDWQRHPHRLDRLGF
jgi:GTP-binding protein Era